MTTVTDSLFAQASTMAKSSFIREDELRNLPSMTRAQLDALEYGAVKVDDSGVIELYNRYEAELANIQPADAEGKSFFTQVAECALGPTSGICRSTHSFRSVSTSSPSSLACAQPLRSHGGGTDGI